jgi:phosphoglycerate dehydrogenase-like enzyme
MNKNSARYYYIYFVPDPKEKLCMKIVILGAGAIGRLLGVFLSKGEHQVVLVDPNQEKVDVLNSRA